MKKFLKLFYFKKYNFFLFYIILINKFNVEKKIIIFRINILKLFFILFYFIFYYYYYYYFFFYIGMYFKYFIIYP